MECAHYQSAVINKHNSNFVRASHDITNGYSSPESMKSSTISQMPEFDATTTTLLGEFKDRQDKTL